MNNSLTFLNSSWLWPVIAGCIILICIFIWKEWTTSRKQRLVLKSILSLVAIISLALLILKPALLEEAKEHQYIILTNHFEPEQLDSLKLKNPKAEEIDYRKTEDLSAIDEASEVFVIGGGIYYYDLELLEEIPATYLPGQTPKGIVKLNYKTTTSVGEKLRLHGQYAQSVPNTKILLMDASNNTLDSVVLSSEVHQKFTLSSRMKVPGKFIFSIAEKDSLGKIISKNPLPLKVDQSEPLSILILNYFTSFEIKYLKNTLADLNYEVAVKNRITRQRFKFEFFNRPTLNLSKLNSSVLKEFDVVVVDPETLKFLSPSEQTVLQTSIKDEGLGVLFLGDLSQLNTRRSFFNINLKKDVQTEISINKLPELTLEKHAYTIQPEFGLEAIHQSNTGLISAYKRNGMGRVGTTVLSNIWQLKLNGKQDAYQQIWTDLLQQISRRRIKQVTWLPMQGLSTKHEPFEFQLRTSIENPKVKTDDKYHIPLRQDLVNSELWSGRTYPRKSGWHQLNVEKDTTSVFDYFVFEDADWIAMKAYQTRAVNKKYFAKKSSNIQPNSIYTAINPLWFFIVFLVCMGGLWLEPKL